MAPKNLVALQAQMKIWKDEGKDEIWKKIP